MHIYRRNQKRTLSSHSADLKEKKRLDMSLVPISSDSSMPSISSSNEADQKTPLVSSPSTERPAADLHPSAPPVQDLDAADPDNPFEGAYFHPETMDLPLEANCVIPLMSQGRIEKLKEKKSLRPRGIDPDMDDRKKKNILNLYIFRQLL